RPSLLSNQSASHGRLSGLQKELATLKFGAAQNSQKLFRGGLMQIGHLIVHGENGTETHVQRKRKVRCHQKSKKPMRPVSSVRTVRRQTFDETCKRFLPQRKQCPCGMC